MRNTAHKVGLPTLTIAPTGFRGWSTESEHLLPMAFIVLVYTALAAGFYLSFLQPGTPVCTLLQSLSLHGGIPRVVISLGGAMVSTKLAQNSHPLKRTQIHTINKHKVNSRQVNFISNIFVNENLTKCYQTLYGKPQVSQCFTFAK